MTTSGVTCNSRPWHRLFDRFINPRYWETSFQWCQSNQLQKAVAIHLLNLWRLFTGHMGIWCSTTINLLLWPKDAQIQHHEVNGLCCKHRKRQWLASFGCKGVTTDIWIYEPFQIFQQRFSSCMGLSHTHRSNQATWCWASWGWDRWGPSVGSDVGWDLSTKPDAKHGSSGLRVFSRGGFPRWRRTSSPNTVMY